ncbi:HNH endonuclease [Gammaproteobacteria bacterium]|nr:HNH endonuclease [Gammaproteobacteria bacterium]
MKLCVTCKVNERKYNNGKCKECNNAYNREYRKKSSYQKGYDKNWKERYDKMRADPEKLEAYRVQRRAYQNNRRKTDKTLTLKYDTQVRINQCIKAGYFTDKYECVIGCSWEEYRKHIESQWSDKMNWENYGDYWEIDHILPLSKGGSFHYKNTQPLTVTENRKKGNRLYEK